MRTSSLAALLCVGSLLLACGGGQKKTTDPSSTETKGDDGSKEKWEGATPDDQKPRDTSSGSGSSGSGSSGSGSSGSGSSGSGSGSSGTGSGDATSGGGSGSPAGGPPKQRHDQYDKEHTDIVLNRAVRQVKTNCGLATDESGKPSGPWGKVTISVMLGHNGHSKGATVPAPYDGTPPGRCITHAFSILTFPPWAGADTPVDVEVELVKPDAAKPAGK